MLQAAGDAIEGLIFVCFRDHVVVEYGSAEEEIEAAVESFEEGWEFKTAYYNYREGGMSALDALTQSMIDEAFSTSPYNKEPPIGAAIELGRRAGFLVPWSDVGRGGKLRKRYTATAEFLETLIAATVEPKYPLDFPEFLNRLRDDFGIVAGRPEDDRILRQNNLFDGQFGPPTAINEEDLRRNVEKMQQLVVESGYAKAYADGRTVVTTRPEGIL